MVKHRYLILESRGLLEAVDPAVPDAVGDGGEDDNLAFVGLHREAEVSGQVSFLDSTNQTQIDDSVQKTLLQENIFFWSIFNFVWLSASDQDRMLLRFQL